LVSALEDALDSAGDPNYFSAYEELLFEISSARKVATMGTDELDFYTDKVWRERYGEEQ